MPNWFKKKEDGTPEEPSQDALLDAFAAKIEERLKPFQDELRKVSDWQNRVEQEVLKQAPPAQTPPSTPEEQNASEKRALLQINIETRAMVHEERCLNSLGEWDHLKPELVKIFADTPLATKAQPNYPAICQSAVDVLVGREARKGGLRRDNSGKFFIEAATSKTGGEESPLNEIPAWSSDDRTETVSDTLNKMGIDEKEFASNLKSGRLQ